MVGREERVTEHREEKWQVMDERKTVRQIDARIKLKKAREEDSSGSLWGGHVPPLNSAGGSGGRAAQWA